MYLPGKYCIDDIIITHNFTLDKSNETDRDLVLDFAYICVNNQVDVKSLVEDYIYPIGLSVSMMCLLLTFLLYAFLPQLRDLTGKFILGICAFMSMAFAAILVQIFGWKDLNVHELTTELVLHTSIVGVWLCLNAMGHHVWKIIRSKSVFTRVTDGQRLRYYSVYIIFFTALICGLAICVHVFVEDGRGVGEQEIGN
jgi:G protein-coupled receptor Mth (Methuselah protein)